jgi:hypothetical protein
MRFRVLAAAAALLAATPALARAPHAPGSDGSDGPPGWSQPQPICSAELSSYCPDPGLQLGLCLRERLDMSPGCPAIQESGSAQPAWRDQAGRDPPGKPPG